MGIDGLMKGNRHLDALHIFSEMKLEDIKPDTVVYNIILNGLVSSNQELRLVLRYWNELHNQGLEPDIITYNIVIRAYMKNKSPTEALKLLDKLHYQGLKPDTVTYNEFLVGFRENDDTDNVTRIEKEMKNHKIPIFVGSRKMNLPQTFFTHNKE